MFLRKILGGLISKIIMPSQKYAKTSTEEVRKSLQYPEIQFQHINSAKQSQIALFECANGISIGNDTKVMLYVYSNGDYAENHFKELSDKSSRNPNIVIAGMNFRNVTSSGPGTVNSEQDWIDDIISVVDHYRKKGVPLKNILLNGHSLGAAIATMAAMQIYQQEIKKSGQSEKVLTPQQKLEYSLRLLNNRSFSSLADEIMISLLGGFNTGIIGAIVGGIAAVATIVSAPMVGAVVAGFVAAGAVCPQAAEFFVRPVLNISLWAVFGTMNAFKAYQTLPEGAKDYVIAKDDLVIRERATIHHKLKSQRKVEKEILTTFIKDEKNSLEKRKDALDALINLKDSKLVFAGESREPFSAAHGMPLRYLRTKHKLRQLDLPFATKCAQVTGEVVLNQKIQKLIGK